MLYPISPVSTVMMSTDIYHSKFEFQIIEILCDFSRIFFPSSSSFKIFLLARIT